MNQPSPAVQACAQTAAVSDGAVRAGPLGAIPELLRKLGQDPIQVFATAGLDLHLLDDPENAVPFRAVGRLLDACVHATGCPHFGLLAGQQRGLGCMGVVGMLAQHSPTVKQALRNIVLNLHLHDRGGVPTFSASEGVASFGYAIYQPGLTATRQIYDGAAAIACNILRALCGPGWIPRYVLLSRARPRDLAPYRRVFGVTPRFDAEETALGFAVDWLERPVPGADPALYRMLRGQVSVLAAQSCGDLRAQVRRIVCNLLHCGNGSLESAANVLAMHPRTLNRRLQDSGATFRQLRDECRCAIAQQLLLDSRLSIHDIAARLQYADGPAFIRAFRRWSGSTPAAWRAERQES